jgi:hypothetical protein
MYMSNTSSGQGGGGGGSASGGGGGTGAAPATPFSPFFDHLSLGSMTMDYPSRQLSPGMASGRLPYQQMAPASNQAPAPAGGTAKIAQQQDAFDADREKKKMLSVTNNLASMERFSQMDKQQQDSYYNNKAQQSQQTPSMVAPPGTQMIGSSFFESPLMSNTMMNEYARQLSPPQQHSLLPPLATSNPSSGGMGDDQQQKLKKSAAVVNNLMQAERQTQKKKNSEGGGEGVPPPPPPPTRLFAPLSADQQQQQQMRPPGGALLGSNLIRPSRLSTSEDAFFDLPFGDYGYTFSPGEIVRTLGTTNGAISESPLTQNMRMSFPYPGQYASQGMMAPPPQAMASTSNWPQQYQHSRQPPMQHHQFAPSSQLSLEGSGGGGRHGKGERKRQATSKLYSDDDDDDEHEKPMKKKNKKGGHAQKVEDPDEPRITSKHRGVCWYKRTKKWVVQTKVNGKRVHVGYFDDEEKAAEAYKNAVQGIQVKKALEAKQKSMQQQQQLNAVAAGGGLATEGGLPLQPVQTLQQHQHQQQLTL